MSKSLFAAVAALAVLTGGPAWAHSLLKASVPGNRASVSALHHVTMTFTKPVRLTVLKLTKAGKNLAVKTDRAAEAVSFAVPVPKLAPGEYQLRWSAMAKDGHAMSGNLSFTIVRAAGA